MKTELPNHFYTDNRIGPYVFEQRLGEGGMAVIDKVWHTGLHRFEALKLPRQRGAERADPAFIHRLLSEARIAAGLHHPHIVTIFNITDEDAPQPYFAMEFVDGYDIGKLLKERQCLPLADAVPILQQVASALDYAHAHGVVHRDVKPSNVLLKERPPGEDMVAPQWLVKVVDFGISRALADNSGGTRLTRNGMIVGTPEYMSPEQAGGAADLDYRTDIYSLGVVVYEMLCGRPPFTAADGASPISVLVKQIHDAPQPPIDHLPHLPHAANDAVLKALAKDAAVRFDTCTDFVTALSTGLEPAAVASHLGIQHSALGSPIAATATAIPAAGVTRPELRNPDAKTVVFAENETKAEGDPPPSTPSVARTRSATLLAGLGGLLAGAWLVHTLGAPPQVPNKAVSTPLTRTNTPATPKVTLAKPISTVTTTQPRQSGLVKSALPTLVQRRWVQKRLFRAIPFAHRVTRTQSLLVGRRRTTRRGQPGRREVLLKIGYQGSKEISRQIVGNRIVKTPVPQLELAGVRQTASAPRTSARTVHKKAAASVHSGGKAAAVRKRRAKAARKSAKGMQRSPGQPRGRDVIETIVGELLKRGGRQGRDRNRFRD